LFLAATLAETLHARAALDEDVAASAPRPATAKGH
jgi:hypothetical protein